MCFSSLEEALSGKVNVWVVMGAAGVVQYKPDINNYKLEQTRKGHSEIRSKLFNLNWMASHIPTHQIIVILSFDIAPFPYKHAQRKNKF